MKYYSFYVRLICLLTVGLFFSDVTAQVRFEADFNTKEVGSSPLWITTVGERIFFSADDGLTGREPWLYVPAVDQAFLLKNINAESASSSPREVTVIDEAAYFIADSGVEQQLWVLRPGTNAVTQIPTDIALSEITSLTHYDDAIYFRAKHYGDTDGNIFLYRYLLNEDTVEEVVNDNADFNLNTSSSAMQVHQGELYLQGFLPNTFTNVLLRYSSTTEAFELIENQYTSNGEQLFISDFRSFGDHLAMHIRNPANLNNGHFGFYETGSDSIIIDLSAELLVVNPVINRTIEVAGDRLFIKIRNQSTGLLRSYNFSSREFESIPGVDEEGVSIMRIEVLDDQLLYFVRSFSEPFGIRQLDPVTGTITALPYLPFLEQALSSSIYLHTFNVFANLNGVWYSTGANIEDNIELYFFNSSNESTGQLTDVHQGSTSGIPIIMQTTSDNRLLVRASFEFLLGFQWVDYDPATQSYEALMPEIEWNFHSKLYQLPGYLVASRADYEGVTYDAVAFDSLTGNYIPFLEEMSGCGFSSVRGSGTFVAFNGGIYYTRCDGERVQLYRHEMGVAGAVAVTDFPVRSLAKSSLSDESIAQLGDELIIPVAPDANSIFTYDLYSFDGDNLTPINLGEWNVRGPVVFETPSAVYFAIEKGGGDFYPAYINADSPEDLHFLTYQGDTIKRIFTSGFHQADSSVYFSYEEKVFRHHPSSEEVELYYTLPDTLESLFTPFIYNDRLLFSSATPDYGLELYELVDLDASPRRVSDIRVGPPDSQISSLIELDNRVFFAANDGFRGRELWSFKADCFAIELESVASTIDLPTGAITTTLDGGVAPFTYQWSNGATTASLSDVAAGFYEVTVTDANGCSASQFTWVETNGIISSNDEQDAVSATIVAYPNPFSDQLSLQVVGESSPQMIVRLYTMNGQLLRTALVDRSTTLSIPTSQIPAGNYVVQVLTDAGVPLLVQRVVKQ